MTLNESKQSECRMIYLSKLEHNWKPCTLLLQIVVMKVVSLQLPSGPSMERLPLPFSPTELLWRYPLPWAPPPPSPLGDTKAQLPAGLPPEPRLWTREDVAVFLKWCEREFDLPNFDMDLFQMNGMQIVICK